MSSSSSSMGRLSRVRSLFLTAPLIAIYTAVMGSISVASSLFDSSGRIQHWCARTWARMILWTSGVRVTVRGVEHLRPGAPYILCVNHQSHMDIPILLAALPFQFRFAAKKELFKIPFLGWHLRRSGHISIDRENPRAAIRSLREAGERIRKGIRVVIFPEGGTSLDGEIKPFKGGGFMLSINSQAEVVPITIRGSRAVFVPKSNHVQGGSVDVTVGKPILPGTASASELASRAREEILNTFNSFPRF